MYWTQYKWYVEYDLFLVYYNWGDVLSVSQEDIDQAPEETKSQYGSYRNVVFNV